MEGKQVSPGCKPNDLLSHKSGIFLWCLPIAAVIVGSSWPSMRTWLWIPAFLIMGVYNKLVKQHGSDAYSRAA